ncbi:MAG: PIN domain-containing protein [Treponema sp.]|nr:PIN domain-containing protein [Treponema sp.]
MIIYALDTNIVSYFLKEDKKTIERMKSERDKGNNFIIPPTVYFEIQNWLLVNNSRKKMLIFEKMYSSQGVDVIDKSILDIASKIKIKLRSKGITIGDDVLIAAYCIKNNLHLITNNSRHFKDIEELKIIEWN